MAVLLHFGVVTLHSENRIYEDFGLTPYQGREGLSSGMEDPKICLLSFYLLLFTII